MTVGGGARTFLQKTLIFGVPFHLDFSTAPGCHGRMYDVPRLYQILGEMLKLE